MAEEKIFTVPLREVFDRARTQRAHNASKLVRDFLVRHMKSQNVKIGSSINQSLWARGIQKPPRRIRIHAVKEENVVYSEMLGVDIKTPSKEELAKKEKKKQEKKEKIKEDRKERKKMSIQDEIKEEEGKAKIEPKMEEPKEEKPAEPKEEKPKEEKK